MIAHEVEGFGAWRHRSDGAWVALTAHGRFEARPSKGQYALWWTSTDETQRKLVGVHTSAEATFEAARHYVVPVSASECGKTCSCAKCQHTHPSSVPTSPCGSSERPPQTTSGYATRLDFRSPSDAARIARSIRRRSKAPTHILGAVVYTNADGKVISDAIAATKVTPTFQSIGGGHESFAAGEQAPIIYEDFAQVTRDPEKFEACMVKARAFGPVTSPEAVYRLLAPRMEKQEQELFVVIPLDVHFHLRCEPVEVARGQRESVVVSLRDILRAAIQSGAKYIIVAHNHPTALCKPSAKDLELTDAIRGGCKSVELEFLDHVVIGVGRYYSIAEKKTYRA